MDDQETEPLNINGLIRDSREIMLLLGVTEAADVLPGLKRRLGEPEPQQVDTSTLLDLVRQYGTECLAQGAAALHGSAPDQFHAKQAAHALLARIAGLLPQQPVQARDEDGNGWWIHDCGEVGEFTNTPGDDACDRCSLEGPWRPLLVGGTRAPRYVPDRGIVCGSCGNTSGYFGPEAGRWRCDQCKAVGTLENPADIPGTDAATIQPDLMAQVMAELGVARPEDVLGTIRNRAAAFENVQRDSALRLRQRDEALAEVERLNRVLRAVADPASSSGAPAPQQDGPLRLTLPEVPEGAVALVDRHARRWTLSEMTDLAAEGGWRVPLWESESGALRTYSALLAGSGPLTVEMAPREPRTWPKLDADAGILDDLPERVIVQRHGVWERVSGSALFAQAATFGAIRVEDRLRLDDLRRLGEVFEVFDNEPGGEQR